MVTNRWTLYWRRSCSSDTNQKVKKTPGEDNVTAEMIQAGAECSVEMMQKLSENLRRKAMPSGLG